MDYRPFRIRDGWFCIVDHKMYGPWPDKGSATAGYETELRRAAERKQKINSDAERSNRDRM